MRTRPIFLKGAEAQAAHEGRKTQHRVIMKGVPEDFMHGDVAPVTNGERWAISRSKLNSLGAGAWPPGDEPGILPPLGQVGDGLYVKEPWARFKGDIFYKAEGSNNYRVESTVGWRDPTHMDRHDSRTYYRIVGVHIERLQRITEEDALANGGWEYKNCPFHKNPIKSFRYSWDPSQKIWDENPWVWVYKFKVVSIRGEQDARV